MENSLDDTGFSSDQSLSTPSKENEVSSALKDMTRVLNKLVQRVDNNVSEICALKSTLQGTSASGSRSKKKADFFCC